MRTRTRNPFTTVTTAGLLLPVDLLTRVVEGDPDLKGLSPKDYHLRTGERLNEAASRAWNECLSAWKSFRKKFKALPASDTGTTVTRDEWLLPLFQELGYGRLQSKKAIEIEGKEYPISHGWEKHVPIHLLSARLPLDRRTPGVSGAATRAPYSLLQELLNRSPLYRWGFVSNGRKLYILRDNAALSRAANVEFDLEEMMECEHDDDFLLLFLLCHQSRVEIAEDGKPEDCWLEKWANQADQQGTRAREKLRDGVETAIKSLGAGFLTTKGNNALRERLRTGELSTHDYYRQLLRVVYRLLMLLVAEEKKTENGENLLHPTDTSPEVRDRYARFYSVSRIRSLAYERRGTAHTDLYESLKVLFLKLREGYAPLGIPGMGSFLFSDDSTPDLDDALLTNQDLLDAFRNLCYTEDTSGRGSSYRRPVDFGNLGSEELGSVYESLLELHPNIDTDEGPFTLGTAAGNERKTTGSYYTPTSLINCLLDSALDPVVSEAIDVPDPAEAEQKLLDLKVCDPACGSGHFLIAAAERMAMHLARLRTGDDQPNTLDVQHSKRDIIGRCIYGVDINPMAVELCKVSLWMEALEPGKPLSFLDHHIQCGNSLLGATPRLLAEGIPDDAFKPIEGDDKVAASKLKKQNKKEREEFRQESGKLQKSMFNEPLIKLGNLPAEFSKLTEFGDDSIEDIAAKRERYAQIVSGTDYLNARLLADTWCSAFVWKKDDSDLGKLCPMERDFHNIENSPHSIHPAQKEEVRRLAKQYQFFHWHLAYPDAFRLPEEAETSENEQTGWNGGFDVVLGNPPWERIKLQEKEWFSERLPEIAGAPNATDRRKRIASLGNSDPSIHAEFLHARRSSEATSHMIRDTSCFPLCGRGDVNTYTIFAELNRLLIRGGGRVGCIVPSGIATDDTTKFFFRDLVETNSLVSFFDIENRRQIFQGVHRSFRFCLLTMSAAGCGPNNAAFAFFLGEPNELKDSHRTFSLSSDDIALLNPNTRTCPIFPSRRDAELSKVFYSRTPILVKEGPEEVNPWGIRFVRMFDMANDSHFFRSRVQLEKDGYILEGNIFKNGDDQLLPLYEAKMTNPFDHRHGSVIGSDNLAELSGIAAQGTTLDQHQDPSFVALPRYWVAQSEVAEKLTQIGYPHQYLICFRDVARATDVRTAIQTILPLTAVGHKAPLILPMSASASESCAFLAGLNSFPYDYLIRQKFGSASLSYFVIKQTPFPNPDTMRRHSLVLDNWFSSRVLELMYTAWDLQPFAKDCGNDGPPFRWDEERRFQIRCELDAAYFHLYLGSDEEWGADNPTLREMFPTPRDAVDYIMDTFPIVRRKDEAKYDGDYRTKRTILEVYDQMAEAIRTGQPYQTSIEPPPGPPTYEDTGNFIPFAQWTADLNTSHIHPAREETPKKPQTIVVDPAFPKTDLEKVQCACLLDFVSSLSGLAEDQYVDLMILAMQPQRCRMFLSGDDQGNFDQSLKTVPADLIADADGRPQWRLLLSSLVANRALSKTGDHIQPGDNFDIVRSSLADLGSQFLSLVAKAAERYQELSEIDEPDEATQPVIQEMQQQHANVQSGTGD